MGCVFNLAPPDLHTGHFLSTLIHWARQSLQKMWPHMVDTGLVQLDRQIGQCGPDPSVDWSANEDEVLAGGGLLVLLDGTGGTV